jgi:hypothetical protein
MTGGARALHHEEALLRAHLAMPAAQVAAALAVPGSAPLPAQGSQVATSISISTSCRGRRRRGRFPDHSAGPRRDAPAGATAATAEGIAEDRLENIADVAEITAAVETATSARAALLKRGMAETVIGCTLCGSFRQS